jgi:site-specific DNA-methyltransferase (adenine-specific)
VPTCPVRELDRQSGIVTARLTGPRAVYKRHSGSDRHGNTSASLGAESRLAGSAVGVDRGDGGGASRFFPVFRYQAKAATAERPRADGLAHPTVKPLDLIRWLVRLITPPGGTVLDFCAGSGTTGEACVIEGFPCVLVEREAPYLPLIVARLTKPLQPALDIFGGVA